MVCSRCEWATVNLGGCWCVLESDLSGMGRFYKGEVVEYDAKKKKHKV